MPRPPFNEPQNDQQRIHHLENELAKVHLELAVSRHQFEVLRDLMVRYLSGDQIIALAAEMEDSRREA